MEFNSMNPELNTKQISLSEHAFTRCKERLNLKDKNSALGTIRGYLRKSKRIGQVTSEDGKPSILYTYQSVGIYLSMDLQEVRTVVKHDRLRYSPLRQKVFEMYHKEFRKLGRSEKARIKKLEIAKLEADCEISDLKLRIHKTRSQAVKAACQAHINAIQQHLDDLSNEIKEIQDAKRQVAKSLVFIY